MFCITPDSKLFYSLLNSAGGVGRGYGQCKMIYIFTYFLLMCFPHSTEGCPWAIVLQEKACSSVGPPWAVGEPLLQHLEHFLPVLLIWPWHQLGCFSLCFSLLPCLSSILAFLPFLKYAFPKLPPSWMRGSAVSCSGSLGGRQLCLAQVSGLLPQRPP